MRKTVGALFAVALVIFGASLIAQQQPGRSRPLPVPIPAGSARMGVHAAGAWRSATAVGAANRRQRGRADCRQRQRRSRAASFGRKRKRWIGIPRIVAGRIPRSSEFGKQGVRQCNLCHLPDGAGRPENAPIKQPASRLFHPADAGLPERAPEERRSAQGEHQHDDRLRQGDDARGGPGGGGVLRAAAVPASLEGGGIEDGAQGAPAGRDAHGRPGWRGRRHGADRARHDRRGARRQPARRGARHAHGLDRLRPTRHAEEGQADRRQGSVRHVPWSELRRDWSRCRRSPAGRPATRCGSCSTSRRAHATDRGAS